MGIESLLRFLVRANARQAKREFNEVKKSVEGVGKAAKKTGDQGQSGFQRFAGAIIGLQTLVSGLVITFAGFQIVNAIRQWGKEIIDFNKEFANVTTLIDTSEVSVQSLRTELLDLGGSLGSASELARGLYQTLSAGVAPAQAVRFVAEAAMFAQAALTDTFTAVDVLTTVINAYGLSATQAGEVSDKLFEIIKQGKTTGEELSGALGRVIPTAATLNVSFNELGAALATMTKGGINTNESVTSLNQAMLSFLKPTKQASDLAKKLDIDLTADALASKGFAAALKDMAEKTRGNAEATAILFGNVRALKAILTLTGPQAQEFERILVQMGLAAGNTAIAFEKQTGTLGFQMTALWNNLTKLFISSRAEASGVTVILRDMNLAMEEGTKGGNFLAKTGLFLSKIFTVIAIGAVFAGQGINFFNIQNLKARRFILSVLGPTEALDQQIRDLENSSLLYSERINELNIRLGNLVKESEALNAENKNVVKSQEEVIDVIELNKRAFKDLLEDTRKSIKSGEVITKVAEVYGNELLQLSRALKRQGVDVSGVDKKLVELLETTNKNAKANKEFEASVDKVTKKFKDFKQGNEALIVGLNRLKKDGTSSAELVEVFSKELLDLAKSSDFATSAISSQVRALVEEALRIERNEKSLKALIKQEEKIEKAYVKSDAALKGLTLSLVKDKEALRQQIQAILLATEQSIDLADAVADGDKILSEYDKTVEKNVRLTVKWAQGIRIASTELDALIGNLENGKGTFITTNQLLDELGVTQIRSVEATGILISKLEELEREGVISARELNEAYTNFFQEFLDQSRDIPPQYLEVLKELVLDTDIQIAGKARSVWDEYWEGIKRRGGELPEDVKKINDQIREENKRATKDLSEQWDKQISTIVTDWSNGVADILLEGAGLRDTLRGIFKETAKGIVRTWLENMFTPLKSLFKGFAEEVNSIFKGIGKSIAKWMKGLFSDGAGGGAGFGGFFKNLGGSIGGGLKSLGGLFGGGGGGAGAATAFGGFSSAAGATGGFSAAGGAAGAGGGLFGAGGFAGLGISSALTLGIGAAIAAGFVVWKKFIKKDAFESGAKETGRDFGVAISEGVIQSFVAGLGISKDQFKGIRKDILSSPKFLEDILIPAAQASGSIETLIGRFSNLQTVMGTVDLSEPLRKAIESGDFRDFNDQWFDLFKQSGALVAVFGNDIPGALFGTEIALQDVAAAMSSLIDATGLTEELSAVFIEGFSNIQSSLEALPAVAADLAGQFEGLVGFMVNNGIDALAAQHVAWDQFGGKIIETNNAMDAMGISIPPFIRDLITWAEENDRVSLSSEGLVTALVESIQPIDAYTQAFENMTHTLSTIPEQANALAGEFDAFVSFMASNGIPGVEAMNVAWEEFGGGVLDVFNKMVILGAEIPPFIQELIDWGIENEKLTLSTEGVAVAMEFADTEAGKLAASEAVLAEEEAALVVANEALAESFKAMGDQFINTGVLTDEFSQAITDAGGDLTAFQAAAADLTGLSQFQSEILNLKAAIDELLPVQKSWQELFLATGELTDETIAKITEAGGDIQTFKDFADMQSTKEGFEDLIDEMENTGDVSQALIGQISGLTNINMTALIDEISAAGGSLVALADLSDAAQAQLQAGIAATATVIEDEFIAAAQGLSDELGNINDLLVNAINAMKDALLEAIGEIVTAIKALPAESASALSSIRSDVDNAQAAIDGLDTTVIAPVIDPTTGLPINPEPLLDTVGGGVPSFQHGIGSVPEDTFAFLHRGERVTPASQNRGSSTPESTTTIIFEEGSISLSSLDTADLEELTQERLVPLIIDGINRNIGGAGENFRDSLEE